MFPTLIDPMKPSFPTPFEHRNTMADWTFYDVSNLTHSEFNYLASESFKEGIILVVDPAEEGKDFSLRKYRDHNELKAAPGELIEHFAIAGVGSSDVGAASLARTRANQLGKPVGAIVAGYGMSDIVTEAMGGWFFFGKFNRIQAFIDMYNGYFPQMPYLDMLKDDAGPAKMISGFPNDTATLLELLNDPSRNVKSILGHSKGCLSIAFALNEIVDQKGKDGIAQIKDIEIITLGAVVELPDELTNVRQYIGEIDWFGNINSIPMAERKKVPKAWHHLNTDIPCHMNVTEILEGKYD